MLNDPVYPNTNYTQRLNAEILKFFWHLLLLVIKQPWLLPRICAAIFQSLKAAGKRKTLKKQGIDVPPVIMLSVTAQCNLHCHGCYDRHLHRPAQQEMTTAHMHNLFTQASALGVGAFIIAGGEPLLKTGLLETMRVFPQISFLLFTNALLLDASNRALLKNAGNIVPVISLEGSKTETDNRRGTGVFDAAIAQLTALRNDRILCGVSFTINTENFDTLTRPELLRQLIAAGSTLFFFIEYVPVQENTVHLALTPLQKKRLYALVYELDAAYPAIFTAFPGDEDRYGGCLAAGRGFVHINAYGALEPCPFAPFSDISVLDRPLTEALKSSLLKKVREHHAHLKESSGGCALWSNKEWVASLRSQGPDAL